MGRKRLYRHFKRQATENSYKKPWTGQWNGSVKREDKSLLIASQKYVIRTNYVKTKVIKTQQNSMWKKIMDSNPTICEEKLTTSNPNRKGGFIEKQSQSTLYRFRSAEPSSGMWRVLSEMLSVDGCIKSVKIYKNLIYFYTFYTSIYS